MTRPAAEWLERLTAAGVPCGPVLTRNQVIRHPQVAALGLVVETEHQKAGRLRQTRAAARFSKTPPEIRRGAPALGRAYGGGSARTRLFPRRNSWIARRWGSQRRLIPAGICLATR